MQERGRAGRDGLDVQVTLHYVQQFGVAIEESMKMYCKNTETCTQKFLLKHFDQENIVDATCLSKFSDLCAQNIQ